MSQSDRGSQEMVLTHGQQASEATHTALRAFTGLCRLTCGALVWSPPSTPVSWAVSLCTEHQREGRPKLQPSDVAGTAIYHDWFPRLLGVP